MKRERNEILPAIKEGIEIKGNQVVIWIVRIYAEA